MSSFANLKRNRSGLDSLTKAIEQSNQASEGYKEDTRYWQPTVDKAGNGTATIRFLPAPQQDGDDALPWVRIFHHGFQGPGGWLIDSCPTTLNQPCCICSANGILWNSGIEDNKNIARARKRKLNYIANIYVVSDPGNPENNNTVRLFKFGKKIFEKITGAMHPEFEDITALNPFDLWEGADFKLRIRNVEGYRNYDKSDFASKTPLCDGDDEKLEEIWKSEHSLLEIIDKKNFKSEEVLKARLNKVLGLDGSDPMPKSRVDDDEEFESSKPVKTKKVASRSLTEDDEDSEMNYFQTLANS